MAQAACSTASEPHVNQLCNRRSTLVSYTAVSGNALPAEAASRWQYLGNRSAPGKYLGWTSLPKLSDVQRGSIHDVISTLH